MEKDEIRKDGIYRCSYCRKVLMENRELSLGAAMARLANSGYVVKILALYGYPYFQVFCSREHKDLWIDENVPEEKRKKGDEAMQEMQERWNRQLPNMYRGLAKSICSLKETFNEIKENSESIQGKSKEEIKNHFIKTFNKYQRKSNIKDNET